MFYTVAFVSITMIIIQVSNKIFLARLVTRKLITQLHGVHCDPDQTQPQPTARLIKLLDDVTEFFEDILDSISTLFGFEEKPNKKSSWGITSVLKYTKATVKSVYRIVKDALPVIRIARQSLRSLYPVLPNTTMTIFVQHLLNNLTPELMQKI